MLRISKSTTRTNFFLFLFTAFIIYEFLKINNGTSNVLYQTTDPAFQSGNHTTNFSTVPRDSCMHKNSTVFQWPNQNCSCQNHSSRVFKDVINEDGGAHLFSNCSYLTEYLSKRGFAFSTCTTQLGNQLGLLAMGMALYNQFGIKLLITQHQKWRLDVAIDVERVCPDDGSSFCIVMPSRKPCWFHDFKKRLVNTTLQKWWKNGMFALGKVPGDLAGKYVNLPTYPQFLPWIFRGYLAQFRRDIIFKDEIVDLADEVFTKLLKVNRCLRLKRFQSQDINCTVVVVHLRMGGFNIHVIKKGWVAIQNTTYLPKAFKHVATHYKNPLFLITGSTDSDIRNYFNSHKSSFHGLRIVQVSSIRNKVFTKYKNPGPGIDMLIISKADVVILTYGTFGDFGAILGKDKKEVLYPKGHEAHDESGINWGRLPGFTPLDWKRLQ
ncbi:uncharacterized protein LOC142344189 [Convolutriloba macropyga]|uniref:uncharacterized protein LOC142344189 n=1 Tax=Convolutriloba macropyga TaxID=536237 RepID=UPI003F525EED